MILTFYEFMLRYRGRSSPRAHLAEDMFYAQTYCPKEGDLNLIDTKEKLLDYLYKQGACDNCIDVAKRCWESYRRYLKRAFDLSRPT